jgi:ABC-type polar amino acid transport system ATPase subunit
VVLKSRRKLILNGVSLLKKGEMRLRHRPSGGKSTLLRRITSRAGRRRNGRVGGITLGGNGKHRPSKPMSLRRKIGMVFQQFNLSAHERMKRDEPRSALNSPRPGRSTALARIARSAWRKARLGDQLSSGQQQRCDCRVATVNRRVLFDEPTALDRRWPTRCSRSPICRSGQTMIGHFLR